jgi:hypothetical protein
MDLLHHHHHQVVMEVMEVTRLHHLEGTIHMVVSCQEASQGRYLCMV